MGKSYEEILMDSVDRNVVKMVSHEDKSSQILGFSNGRKESEKTIVQDYFRSQDTHYPIRIVLTLYIPV
jgi:hypothetical protein